MSQNKTVFPGVGNEGDFSQPYRKPAPASYNPTPSPYNRGNRAQGGTVFPGMEQNYGRQNAAPADQQAQPAAPHQPKMPVGSKPVVGFLYSISRTPSGEFWPLHVGQNVIGSGKDCDVQLSEGTVSSRHASLHINKMKKPEKTEATISELGSTNGTLLNDNSVSVARPMECVNGDILVFGENYQMLLVLIDTKAIGLETSPNFIDTAQPEEEDYFTSEGPSFMQEENVTVNRQDFPPQFAGPNPYDGAHRPSDSTVGLNPSQNQFAPGGTKGI